MKERSVCLRYENIDPSSSMHRLDDVICIELLACCDRPDNAPTGKLQSGQRRLLPWAVRWVRLSGPAVGPIVSAVWVVLAWTFQISYTAKLQRTIQAMEMRCYCKILRMSHKDHATTRNSVPRSSRQSDHTKTSWPSYTDANWSGMDMSGLVKTILQGTMKGERR